MHRLSSVLPMVLLRHGYAEQAQAALVTFKARQWVAKRYAHLDSMVQIRMLKDGELTVDCTHSIALQEVQSGSEALLQFLRQECPLVRIIGLRISRS